jgi:hypothetical protein
VKGRAINRQGGSWKIFLNDGRELATSEKELVNHAESFYVDYAFENMTKKQKRRQKQKRNYTMHENK